MSPTVTIILAVVSALSGTAGVELFRSFRDRKKMTQSMAIEAMEAMYPKWSADIQRLEYRMYLLERVIVALSDVLMEQGVDALSIRLRAEAQAAAEWNPPQPE